ncbi:hypothetical protein [Nostoc commune]|uniref:hypothetical protein n=1 Tax=Nostoc commune TaxID=1178 RepID=UPI0018C596BC|nr:hypothetical protein [Nostoc commune]MBG1258405.1 hypothetical protein [Nostoc commune BAE]
MKPLDKFALREMHRKLKTDKVRSLSPAFQQVIELARLEGFSDEEIVSSVAEAFASLKGSEFLIGGIFAASALSLNQNNDK